MVRQRVETADPSEVSCALFGKKGVFNQQLG